MITTTGGATTTVTAITRRRTRRGTLSVAVSVLLGGERRARQGQGGDKNREPGKTLIVCDLDSERRDRSRC